MTVQEKYDELIAYGGVGEMTYYKQPKFENVVYTSSVKYILGLCDSYWLLSEILVQNTPKFLDENEFQVWELKKDGDKLILQCGDGNGEVLFSKEIIYIVDFPLENIKFYLGDGVLILPCEY